MTLLDGDQLLRDLLDHNLEANRAALHDPEHAANIHRLTDEDQARRVSARLVTDLLGTDESNARLHARAKAVTELYEQNRVRLPVDYIPEVLRPRP
ncbi:hypothetical protein [Streptomyces anulatus]|uniref:hypothetical protein n=1 Tax=Streptomyces anulatus TaxID=1892 RepID=UPI0036AA3CB6